MPAIKIRAIGDGGLGLLGGPFAIESCEEDQQSLVVSTVVHFNRWVSDGVSHYRSKGGVEQSSLFKSFTRECFEELTQDNPEAAAALTDLMVICSELPAGLRDDRIWLLHRAILATLPGVSFVE